MKKAIAITSGIIGLLIAGIVFKVNSQEALTQAQADDLVLRNVLVVEQMFLLCEKNSQLVKKNPDKASYESIRACNNYKAKQIKNHQEMIEALDRGNTKKVARKLEVSKKLNERVMVSIDKVLAAYE